MQRSSVPLVASARPVSAALVTIAPPTDFGKRGRGPARVDRAAFEIGRPEAADGVVRFEHHTERVEVLVTRGARRRRRTELGLSRARSRPRGRRSRRPRSDPGGRPDSPRTPPSHSRRARGPPASRRSNARRRAGTSRASAARTDRPVARRGRSHRRRPRAAPRRRRSASRSLRWSRSAAFFPGGMREE